MIQLTAERRIGFAEPSPGGVFITYLCDKCGKAVYYAIDAFSCEGRDLKSWAKKIGPEAHRRLAADGCPHTAVPQL